MRRLVLVVVACVACKHHKPAPPKVDDALAAPDFGAPGPIQIAPMLPKLAGAHATAGWAKDSSELEVCWPGGCVDARPDGTQTPTEGPKPDRDARAQTWAYATDLALTWQQGAAKLEAGAVWKGDPFGGAPIALPDATHPDAIVVSPDGKWLGVVGHATNGYPVAIVPVTVGAGRAYAFAGLERLEEGAPKKAVPLLLKATFADPTQVAAPYDLARAYARLGDPKMRTAFALAVSRGGDEVKQRAAGDADLAAVTK